MSQIAKVISAFFLACIGTSIAHASSFDPTDQGWYRSDGLHVVTPTNHNILTGGYHGSNYNTFFTFYLGSASGMTVTSASLDIFAGVGSYYTDDLNETYRIYDYTGSIVALVNGTGGTAAFADLASGKMYGQTTVPTPDPAGSGTPMPPVSIALTTDALSDLNTLLAGNIYDFAIGGTCTTCGNGQSLWGYSNDNFPAAKLTLNFAPVSPVPLPAAFPLFLTMLGGMGFLRWRRGKRHTV